MTFRNHPTLHSTLLACCLAAAFPAAQAEETSPPATTATTSAATTVGTSANTEAKLTAEFADFLGGEEEAATVVSGLRQGTTFSLDSASGTGGTPGSSTTSTTIDPPTGTMGYGNVRITLRLAQAQLNQLGITQPTPTELSAVLLGGSINGAPVDGILALRADGMGWGQIAQKYGMTVGQIMGKGAVPTQQPATATTATTQTKTTGKAGGSTPKAPASQANSNGYIPSGKAHGTGIVSATGASVGSSGNGGGKGQANKATPSAQGAGTVSAGGQPVSASGASNAGGAKAAAPGQIKKD